MLFNMFSADFFFKIIFKKKIFQLSNSLDPDKMSGMIWAKTIYKGYQQTTLVGKELTICWSYLLTILANSVTKHLA